VIDCLFSQGESSFARNVQNIAIDLLVLNILYIYFEVQDSVKTNGKTGSAVVANLC